MRYRMIVSALLFVVCHAAAQEHVRIGLVADQSSFYAEITALGVSTDGGLLAAAGDGGDILIRDLRRNRELRLVNVSALHENMGDVDELAVQDSLLAVLDAYSQYVVYNFRAGTVLCGGELPNKYGGELRFSPDGSLLYLAGDYAADDQYSLRVLDIATLAYTDVSAPWRVIALTQRGDNMCAVTGNGEVLNFNAQGQLTGVDAYVLPRSAVVVDASYGSDYDAFAFLLNGQGVAWYARGNTGAPVYRETGLNGEDFVCSPDGRSCVVATYPALILYRFDLRREERRQVWMGDKWQLRYLAPNGVVWIGENRVVNVSSMEDLATRSMLLIAGRSRGVLDEAGTEHVYVMRDLYFENRLTVTKVSVPDGRILTDATVFGDSIVDACSGGARATMLLLSRGGGVYRWSGDERDGLLRECSLPAGYTRLEYMPGEQALIVAGGGSLGKYTLSPFAEVYRREWDGNPVDIMYEDNRRYAVLYNHAAGGGWGAAICDVRDGQVYQDYRDFPRMFAYFELDSLLYTVNESSGFSLINPVKPPNEWYRHLTSHSPIRATSITSMNRGRDVLVTRADSSVMYYRVSLVDTVFQNWEAELLTSCELPVKYRYMHWDKLRMQVKGEKYPLCFN
ncbi:MAG TPA: hypothetical protein PK916_17910, partial [Bacteroidota bacterium]|nr:hypothetical protein [Bacteroidota bacterium]